MAQASLPKGATNVGTNLWSDVYNNDNAMLTQVNGNLDATNLASNAVTTTKITDANVTDAKLASPNNSAYKTLKDIAVGGTNLNGTGAGASPLLLRQSDGALAASGTTTASAALPIFYVESDRYAVAGLTTKLRVQMQALVGSTSPSTVTFQAGLYPLTISGGSYQLGAVVAGSTTGSPSPALATNTISLYNGTAGTGDFTLPANGAYALGLVVGSISVPAGISLAIQLQTRNV